MISDERELIRQIKIEFQVSTAIGLASTPNCATLYLASACICLPLVSKKHICKSYHSLDLVPIKGLIILYSDFVHKQKKRVCTSHSEHLISCGTKNQSQCIEFKACGPSQKMTRSFGVLESWGLFWSSQRRESSEAQSQRHVRAPKPQSQLCS